MPVTKSPEEFTAEVYRSREADKALLGNQTPEANVVLELNSQPLGTLAGEANLQTPFNATAKRPNVYVVNHSRKKKRRICKVAVSQLSGAEEALMYEGPQGEQYRKVYGNAENLYLAAKRRDMSIYEEEIEPCIFTIPFNGLRYTIAPASEKDPDNPPIEQIPEGAWDLYCGNYERMHAVYPQTHPNAGAPDEKTRGEEAVRLSLAWSRKHNPVWRILDDGKPTTSQSQFGFVEFIREIPKEAPIRVDGRFVSALELAEVE